LGSAFNNGLYSQVNKDLRRVLGQPESAPWSRAYCGAGEINACRTALWESLSQGALDLESEFSSPNVADWKRTISDDAVVHSAVGVTKDSAIHWITGAAFQQVVQIKRSGGCHHGDGNGTITGRRGGSASFHFHADKCN